MQLFGRAKNQLNITMKYVAIYSVTTTLFYAHTQTHMYKHIHTHTHVLASSPGPGNEANSRTYTPTSVLHPNHLLSSTACLLQLLLLFVGQVTLHILIPTPMEWPMMTPWSLDSITITHHPYGQRWGLGAVFVVIERRTVWSIWCSRPWTSSTGRYEWHSFVCL